MRPRRAERPSPQDPSVSSNPSAPAPQSFGDTLVVTASRAQERLTDAVAPTSVLTREDLDRSPGLTLDEQLRQIPGFSLLRRSSSLTAHPTSQGVSLRGLGPSGASRTLVLFDGVPLNDPFGGWVYWNRL
ncbi:MAG: TonB-dependent receptor plug domain-containing protein, partial [Thermoanaerobaculia bacterium]